jgi:murein DD-endopeptidase MepM/ murein hydrolase activator NlpD
MAPLSRHFGSEPGQVRRSGVIALIALGLVVGLLAPTAADADDKAKKRQVDKKVEAVEDNLAESSKAVAKASADLKRAEVEIPKAKRELREARTDLSAAREVEQVILAELARAQAKAAREQERVDEVMDSMATTRRTIGAIARTVYTQGPYAEVELVLESQDPGDFAERLQSVRTVVKGQDRALAGLAELRADLQRRTDDLKAAQFQVEERRQEATKKRQSAEALADKAEAAKARIDRLVAARESALRVANREKERTAQQLERLKREQERLAALLAGPGKGAGFPSGSLQWPTAGGLSQGVGPRVHPVYGYASCHTGVDIRGSYGTPILASAAGKVIQINNGGPYGLHTVISHGDGVTVMIAHQSSVAVGAGSIVQQGQVVGYVGTTGWVTGAHLHWEVHVNGVPYDPMGWFGGSRSPVSCWNS